MTSPRWTAATTPCSWLRALSRSSGRAVDGSIGWSASSRKRRTARALSRRHRSTRSPVGVGAGERVDGRGELGLLGGEERDVVHPGAFAQAELEQQLRAHVAEVADRLIEPALRHSAAGGGRRQHHTLAAPAGGVPAARHQALVHQAVDGPVRERSAERPDPPELAIRGEHRAEGPAVRPAVDDEGEADVLREGGLEVGRGDRHREAQ